jgi:hypothetical protein
MDHLISSSNSRQDDVFQHAMRQVYQQAPPELVAGFQEKMEFIRVRYKHNERAVESCVRGLGNNPTLLQILTAAFVLNGGVLFKHGPTLQEEEADERELNKLIQEFDELRNVGCDDQVEETAS